MSSWLAFSKRCAIFHTLESADPILRLRFAILFLSAAVFVGRFGATTTRQSERFFVAADEFKLHG